MKIRQLPEDERPREKLLKDGSDKLSTAEVLAILVGSGGAKRSALDIAAEILSLDRRGVAYLGECRPEEIMSVKGVGRAKACEILAAVELGKRIAACPREERRTITTSADIAAAVMEKMRYYKKEHFICMLINARRDHRGDMHIRRRSVFQRHASKGGLRGCCQEERRLCGVHT